MKPPLRRLHLLFNQSKRLKQRSSREGASRKKIAGMVCFILIE
ncbi:hypothetical protein Godav_021168 [Gossypium davidsonii]|uniref:Uncharacterized protein n=2 Tax=Gossypium TaxID=3633 RepID=A0A7J8R598_GOSDV|nr:hypothetical protein [Gossypium davidsonii]MBA0644074.1 hypothetical protein [Gossypium klotzschianum]